MSSETKPPHDVGAQREADIYDVLAWLEVNKKKVGIVAVVLVLIGFAISTIRYFKQQKEDNASASLLALKPTLNPATNVPPVQASALLKVADEHAGTAAAERARILAGTAFFSEGRYADAEKEFSQFEKNHPDSPWVAEAAYGVATSQEAQNKTAEAQASYQKVATAYSTSPLADDANLALARIYESQNKPDQALRIYNQLLVPKPGAQPGEIRNAAAAQKKEALLRVHPELGTNFTARPLPAPAAAPATNAAATPAANTNAPAPAAQSANPPATK